MLMEVVKDLWRDKPLFFTVVAGLAVVLYLLYKQNSGASATPTTASPAANAGNTGPGSTLVENSYYSNAPVSNTTYSTPVANTLHALPSGPGWMKQLPSVVAVATKGTSNAGNKDTNWWPYTVTPGQTISSVVSGIAKWGNDTTHFINYRNNKKILQAAGVDVNNPYAQLPTGLVLSV